MSFYQAPPGVDTAVSQHMTFVGDGELSFALAAVFVVSIGAQTYNLS